MWVVEPKKLTLVVMKQHFFKASVIMYDSEVPGVENRGKREKRQRRQEKKNLNAETVRG